VNLDQVLTAIGLTVWLGVLVAAAGYVAWRMRFPPSRFNPDAAAPIATRVIGSLVGLAIFGYYAFAAPNVIVVVDVFLSGFITYVLLAYAVALTVERRRAKRFALPEPGTGGTASIAESAAFLAIALLLAVAALLLTIYGAANELGGNGREGLAGLGLGAFAWVIAMVMGIYGLPSLLLLLRYRR